LTPAWQAPDEPAHYNYVAQLADGILPRIDTTDYDQAYQSTVISSRFDPQYDVASFTYEDWQPPLYYLTLTPFFALSGGSLVVLRFVSVLLGAGVLLFTYAIGLRLFPQVRWPALAMVAFIGFLPQHLAILSSVNNDVLAELLIAAMLYVLLVWYQYANPRARRQWPRLVGMGVLLGLGFLTKATVYLMAPVLLVAVLWVYWRQRDGLPRALALLFGPALLLGLLFWGRNLIIYPGFDPMAIAAHDRVVVGQLRTVEWLETVGFAGGVRNFISTTFRSFWGQFGWMAAPFPSWVYWPLTLFTALTVAGLGVAAYRFRGGPPPVLTRMMHLDREMRIRYGLLLALLFMLNVGLYLYYNVSLVQHQGRYFFPSLIPIAAAVVVGWRGLLGPYLVRSQLLRYGVPAALTGLLAGLALYGLFFTVIPELSL
jgi:4-amino-4-deoxy-L-arabinose transferase-like glycosyltransferase